VPLAVSLWPPKCHVLSSKLIQEAPFAKYPGTLLRNRLIYFKEDSQEAGW